MELETGTHSAKIERIVETYTDELLRLALHYTRSRADAEDVVQTVYLALVAKRPRFISHEHEHAFLLRATINAAKNHVSSAYQKRRAELTEDVEAAPPKERESGVLDAVKGLPESDRAVVFLYYYKGYSSGEISRLLKQPEGTVTSRLHRARAKLATILKGESDGAL